MVYNAEMRNNGTARRCTDALRRIPGMQDVKRYNRPPYKEMDTHPLYIMIDDGRDEIEWVPPRPNALWCVDTHLGYDARAEWARQCDHVYCAQKEGAQRMSDDGIEARWLPLACHPPVDPNQAEMLNHPRLEEVAGGEDLNPKYDVAFVGFMPSSHQEGGADNINNRLDYLERLFRELPNSWLHFNCFFEDAAVRYIRARLGFNVSIKNDLNMRFFEVMSYGTCLLTNERVDGWRDLGFENGKHFIGYDDEDDMVAKAKWALEHPMEREEIARAGHKKVREEHTYRHRMSEILKTCLN